MYGKTEKCRDQQNADRVFVDSSISQFGSRESACEAMLRFGWRYYSEDDWENSMKRFNQAWLLDSTNADVYTGFAYILNDQAKFDEALAMIYKSLELSPQNSSILRFSAQINENLYKQTKDSKYLEQSIANLKQSIGIDPDATEAYAILADVYNIYHQKDSAERYRQIADSLDRK